MSKSLALPEYEPSLPESSLSVSDYENQITSALAICDTFDLQTQIWRGRLIEGLKNFHVLNDCPSRTELWLKSVGISPKKAEELILIANVADDLIDRSLISDIGIKNITPKAFLKSLEIEEASLILAEEAESGIKIDLPYAKQIVNEQVIYSSDCSDKLKLAVETGGIKSGTASGLIKELDKIEEEEEDYKQEVQNTLELKCDRDSVKQLSQEVKAFNKYRENAPYSILLLEGQVDLDKLLAEAKQLSILPLVASMVTTIKNIEELSAKLQSKLRKFTELSDRLFVESGSAYPEIRKMAEIIEAPEDYQYLLPISDLETLEIRIKCKKDKRISNLAENS